MWNSVWNLENPLHKLTICWRNFMVMDVSSRTQVFEWLKRFKDGREEIGDDQRPGRSSTSKTDANNENAVEIVGQNRRLRIRAIAELINVDKGTVRQILHNNFNNFNIKKRVRRWCRYSSLLNKRKFEWTFVLTFKTLKTTQHFRERSNLWRIMVFFNTAQKVNGSPCTGRAPVNQGKRKHGRANPNLKQRWSLFPTSEGFFTWTGGQTVNQVYYKEILTKLRERVRRRPEMWKNGSWVLHQENSPAHNALSVKMFLMKRKITVFEHPPCSPWPSPMWLYFTFQRSNLR